MQNLKFFRNRRDELVRVELADSNFSLRLKSGIIEQSSYTRMRLMNGSQEQLSLETRISVLTKSIALLAKSGQRALTFDLTFPSALPTLTGLGEGVVKGFIDGRALTGAYDVQTKKGPANLALDAWLSPDDSAALAPFQRVFKRERAVKAILTAEFPLRAQPTTAGAIQPMAASWGRAACWGFGSLGAAAVCAGGFGLGCAAGAFLFAATASYCNDQY